MRTDVRWIRLLCLVLCLAVLLPCAGAGAETTKVAAYLLRLRETPSDSGKVLDAYPRGTVVTILKKGDTWSKVRVHEKTGYMMTSMLKIGRDQASAASSGTNTTTTARTTTAVTAASLVSGETAYVMKGIRLNLREGATSDSEIIASFRGGTKVTILKKGRYWSRVSVNGYEGYMANEYLTTERE